MLHSVHIYIVLDQAAKSVKICKNPNLVWWVYSGPHDHGLVKTSQILNCRSLKLENWSDMTRANSPGQSSGIIFKLGSWESLHFTDHGMLNFFAQLKNFYDHNSPWSWWFWWLPQSARSSLPGPVHSSCTNQCAENGSRDPYHPAIGRHRSRDTAAERWWSGVSRDPVEALSLV